MNELVSSSSVFLKTKCEKFDFSTENSLEIYNNLGKILQSYESCLSLTANQIGICKRVFVIRSNPILDFFNPIIVDTSNEMIELEETSISYPGIVVKVNRPKHIKIRFSKVNQEIVTEKFTGLTARYIQQCMDQINGYRFFDSLSSLKKEILLNKLKKQGIIYKRSDIIGNNKNEI